MIEINPDLIPKYDQLKHEVDVDDAIAYTKSNNGLDFLLGMGTDSLKEIKYHPVKSKIGKTIRSIDYFFKYHPNQDFRPWIKHVFEDNGMIIFGGPDVYQLQYIDDDCPSKPTAILNHSETLRNYDTRGMTCVTFRNAEPPKFIYDQYELPIDFRVGIYNLDFLPGICKELSRPHAISDHSGIDYIIKQQMDILKPMPCDTKSRIVRNNYYR